ncbi:quinoprotein dehydrogenase-associated SoxYZ-like carrier [Methylibium sp.]|uniref:quinoprotein dehydrogenase-associated SoxYZ-like carrier n=1 Tax=Methylibium sp. TaxID=2067992 RepID=UPI003D13B3F9
MFPEAVKLQRRQVVLATVAACVLPVRAAADEFGGDPYRSAQWPEMVKEFLGAAARVEFDPRVQVKGPTQAENPMVVPITVTAPDLHDVQQIMVLVDRNPIRKVLEFEPLAGTQAAISFRFKLEQASAVRAAARTRDGVWHVGGTWVESSGGGCTVSGASRQDGSWAQTLGQVSGRFFGDALDTPGARLRVRVMHPMDTGLVGGIPAFYLRRMAVIDAGGVELLRLSTFEPISENPVFSFDFKGRPPGPFHVTGVDNNGNRIDGQVT